MLCAFHNYFKCIFICLQIRYDIWAICDRLRNAALFLEKDYEAYK